MHQLSISELSQKLREKCFSCVELAQHYLTRIQKLDSTLNAFITVDEERVLAEAQAADQRLSQGDAPTLTGIPIAHKDIFCTAGMRTSCGSKMLADYIAPYDATVITQYQQAGAIILGKTNMDEFAMGSSNEASHFGPCRNPWHTDYVPGGSSGGSASAVAARLAPAATGTDTGGSIRQPAAYCGITGLKPTYGRVSRYGMIAYASSLDQGGPMAASAEDLAILMQAMAGFDPKDSTSSEQAVPDYHAHLNNDIQGLRLGVPKAFLGDGVDSQTAAAVQASIDELVKLGAKVIEIDLPHVDAAIAAYYIIAPAEASSNLARYDGVRYGYRCSDPVDLTDMYQRSRSEGFGEEVKRRIMIGTYALSAGYYDAFYRKAQQVRHVITQGFIDAFKQVDLIIGPTTPNPAFKLNEHNDDPVDMYLNDVYTVPVNLAGLPALSMPVGFSNDLPVGAQLIGNYFTEDTLLNVAHRYQQVTDWHKRCPAAYEGDCA